MLWVLLVAAISAPFILAMVSHGRAYKRFVYGDDLRELRESAVYKAISDPHERWKAESEFTSRQAKRFWH